MAALGVNVEALLFIQTNKYTRLYMHILSPWTRFARASPLSYAMIVAALVVVMPLPTMAGTPMVKIQAQGYFRMMLGDFEVTAVSDSTTMLPTQELLQQTAEKTISSVTKAHLTVPTKTSVNAFLINTESKHILIVAQAGNFFEPTLGKLIENIHLADYTPERVDDILITHLHPDHIGVMAFQGCLLFPNDMDHAKRRDSEFWLSPVRIDTVPAPVKEFFQGAMASLDPYISAYRYQFFDSEGGIVVGVRSMAAYGHTEAARKLHLLKGFEA